MQKRVGLVKGRAGPLLPQITRVNFAWLVFAACTVSKSLAPPANMMVTVNPFAHGDFAEKRVLKLVEWFSGHCRAIKS